MEYIDTEDPEQRRKEMHCFYEVFLPAQKRYGLTAECKTSLFDDSSIRIWQGEGRNKQLIIKAENASETRCYAVATGDLQQWLAAQKERERKMQRVC